MPELAWPAICAVCTTILVAGEFRDWDKVRGIAKSVAVFAFLAYAWQRGAWAAGDAGKVGFIALIFCGIGDLCLLSRERLPFAAGILSFLLGHVGYIGMFWLLGFDLVPAAIAAIPVGVLAMFVWSWVKKDVGPLAPAVGAYVFVISAMVAVAVGIATSGRPVLLVAAVVFFVSDLCVARDRFVKPGWPNRLVGLPLYFGAQLIFAYGMTS